LLAYEKENVWKEVRLTLNIRGTQMI
jgi:hypothetical protein